ncbi:MAG: hypothetical protein LKI25_01750 [Atopobiaceae bacterium]|jgi:hypothetical protein|nr:hypothetical protein [Atopobiaceae bacterium]MCI2172933.1 hypothetical protein [Atopobiaceae bacterium]MCI2208338.1 hypothetical protein [Atopobiaceae bacterium]
MTDAFRGAARFARESGITRRQLVEMGAAGAMALGLGLVGCGSSASDSATDAATSRGEADRTRDDATDRQPA